MILDATTRKLQILMDATATTTESPCVANWVDLTPFTTTPGSTNSISNGVTAVDVVAAPAASTQRVIQSMTVYNADTVNRTVTVRYNDNATTRIIAKVLLSSGQSLSYTAGAGWQVVPATTTQLVTVKSQVFTASGTYTPTTGMTYCIIESLGGGAGGGGIAGTNTSTGAGGGGGAGSYSRLVASATTVGTSQTVTIGAGGAGGTAGNNAGTNGGDTSVGSLCIGKGGTAGGGGASVPGAPGAGGIAGTGDVTGSGATGGMGVAAVISTLFGMSGAGADSPFGGGGKSVSTSGAAVTAGSNGTGYGAGGSGAVWSGSNSTAAGGAGTGGLVIVTEFLNR